MTDPPRSWTQDVELAAVSHIGMRRLNNQDAHLEVLAEDESTWLVRGHMFVVADGMGAHAAGELASKMAVDGVVHHYRKHRQLSPPEALLKALRDANSEIHQRGQANSEFHNMGTTCSTLLLLPQGALVAHVGDSRIYRARGPQLLQLTFDHSLVWEMRAATGGRRGGTTANIPKNVITRSLGPQPDVQVDVEGPFDVQTGDTFLICSDGLTGKVEDEELGIILAGLPPAEAAQLLVDLANLRGGPDNVTVIVVRVVSPNGITRSPHPELWVLGPELQKQRTVHSTVWATILMAVLLAAGLALLRRYLAASMAASVAFAAAAIAWWQRFGSDPYRMSVGVNRLGKGPYARVDCEPTAGRLDQIGQSLREVARQRSDVEADERARVDACLDEAHVRAQQNDVSGALRMLTVAARVLAAPSTGP